ncbi:MAG: OmpA family protein [Acidobacteria bacterium]|nr:OmpA family protein [Acidobacteriota bacterium]
MVSMVRPSTGRFANDLVQKGKIPAPRHPTQKTPGEELMTKRSGHAIPVLAACATIAAIGSAPAQETASRTDFLTLAQGALPISWSTTGPRQPGNDIALAVVDGNHGGFSLVGLADAETATEFVFELPALTSFDRFAVPEIHETPSPSQTFSRIVEIYGSADGLDADFELIAQGELATHAERGLVTDLDIVASPAVRWVKVRLVGGIDVQREQMYYEFSEIIGNGEQETVPLSEGFNGIWRGRGVLVELKQVGPTVTGCYGASGGLLSGTVSGNVLRARGEDMTSGVESLFVLLLDGEGGISGVSSSNGAPFRLYAGGIAPDGTTTRCTETPEPELGCGSVIHGINFDFDSADLRADAAPVLEQLYDGLAADAAARILIEGHTSSEGADDYNLALSGRRAQSVVDDLVRRGISADRIEAAGIGEVRPIATNDDESGRAMNRRVEVVCAES